MNKILKNNGDDTFTDLYYFPLGHLAWLIHKLFFSYSFLNFQAQIN
jgi:hypothetical protein